MTRPQGLRLTARCSASAPPQPPMIKGRLRRNAQGGPIRFRIGPPCALFTCSFFAEWFPGVPYHCGSFLSGFGQPWQQEQQPGQPVFFFFRSRRRITTTMTPTAARIEISQKLRPMSVPPFTGGARRGSAGPVQRADRLRRTGRRSDGFRRPRARRRRTARAPRGRRICGPTPGGWRRWRPRRGCRAG